MHTMHTFYFFFYNPLYSKGLRGVEGMSCLMHTARIPMHTTGFFSNTGKKKRPGLFRYWRFSSPMPEETGPNAYVPV